MVGGVSAGGVSHQPEWQEPSCHLAINSSPCLACKVPGPLFLFPPSFAPLMCFRCLGLTRKKDLPLTYRWAHRTEADHGRPRVLPYHTYLVLRSISVPSSPGFGIISMDMFLSLSLPVPFSYYQCFMCYHRKAGRGRCRIGLNDMPRVRTRETCFANVVMMGRTALFASV